MSGTAYKALGFVVFNGAKWYLRRRFGRLVPSRKLLAALAVGGSVISLAAAQGRAARSP